MRFIAVAAIAVLAVSGCSKDNSGDALDGDSPYSGLELAPKVFEKGKVTIDVPADAKDSKAGVGWEFADAQGSNGQFYVFAVVVDKPVSEDNAHEAWLGSPNNRNEWSGNAKPAVSDVTAVDGGFSVTKGMSRESGGDISGTARVATLREVGGKTVACVADWNNWAKTMATGPAIALMKKICMSAKPTP